MVARLRTNVIKREYTVKFELYGQVLSRTVWAESEECAKNQIVKAARILSVEERRGKPDEQ